MAWKFAEAALKRFKKNPYGYTVYDEISKVEKPESKHKQFWGEDVVNCNKCKCFLYKKDSYREANMIPSNVYSTMTDIMTGIWGYPIFTAKPKELTPDKGDTTDYEIEELFYCQKCKPVKKVTKKKKTNK